MQIFEEITPAKIQALAVFTLIKEAPHVFKL